MKEMEELVCRLLWAELQSIGCFIEECAAIEDIKAKIRLCSFYEKWFDETLAVFERNGYIRCDGEVCHVMDTTRVNLDNLWKEWTQKKNIWLEEQDIENQLVLMETTLKALTDILTGEKTSTEVIFPNSSMELIEGAYRDNPVSDYFNEVTASIIETYLKERIRYDPDVQIRIIEVGAGTGGTSTMVFQKLQSYRGHVREYCYTDISKSFLLYAEKEYGSLNPYLKYKNFNVERPAHEQGIDIGGYDIVIATNVLHATKNIRETLRNVKSTLKKNGLILLNELSLKTIFNHITFGLLEGWWRFDDTELRIPGCPVVSSEMWRTVMQDEGFRSVFFPAEEAHELGQQIIVAESDGIIRQQNQVKTSNSSLENSTLLSQFNDGDKGAVNRMGNSQGDEDITIQMIEEYIRETIVKKLTETLKIDEYLVDNDMSFADYGVDSITGIRLIQSLNDSLGTDLEITELFDYNSVDRFTKHILHTQKDKVNHDFIKYVNNPSIDRDKVIYEKKKNEPPPLDPENITMRLKYTDTIPERDFKKEPIAIIGMSGRFAKSDNIKELWCNLSNGVDLVQEATRWNDTELYPHGKKSKIYGSFLEDIDRFDPLFFNISGAEAIYMDPQQRLFLEESWKALEDAGYVGTGISGRNCGVYVGYGGGDYQQLFGNNIRPQAFWGSMGAIVPARIAYYLDIKGPAIAVDTACSSSLVAIHLACQGLWSGETEMAIAGGVSIQCTPSLYIVETNAGMLSPTGRCHTFDEEADGFIPGEGVGAVVLKRLKDALADGDNIHGVIRGTGINQDGTTNGITAPSAKSQESLECYVYDNFGIAPEHIQVVEAHGTGTKLGDPIEYQALTRAFRKYTDKKEYCAIGSIKTNIGHTQMAAGIAGVIKLLLAMKYKKIPPSLHFKQGNSNIRFKDSPFYVNTTLREWEKGAGGKRCAAISSFGASGTNAHMIIEEAPVIELQNALKPGYMIALSARSNEQLVKQAKQLIDYCETESQVDCGNMSYTLILGRKHFNHRLACIVQDQQELAVLLKDWLEKGEIPGIYSSEIHKSSQRDPALKKYGNQCIQNIKSIENPKEYIEQLSNVADLYVKGYELEYKELFLNDGYCRISLPTYPFERESYWVPRQEIKSYNRRPVKRSKFSDYRVKRYEQKEDLTGSEFSQDLQYEKSCELMTFEETLREEALSPTSSAGLKTLVFFVSNPEYQHKLSEVVRNTDNRVNTIFISRGTNYQKQSEQNYSMDFDIMENYREALKSIHENYGEIDAIIHISSLEKLDFSKETQYILYILQTVAQLKLKIRRILLAGQYKSGIECCYMESWIGFERSLGLVLPNTQVGLVIQETEHNGEDMLVGLGQKIIEELLKADKVKSAFYKDGKRYVYSIEPTKIGSGDSLVKPEGTYLITGGCGGLGLVLAEHFAKAYPVNLILTGRSSLDEGKKLKIKKLESLGSKVLYIQADVCDLDGMKKGLKQVKERFGNINGVIHAAGQVSNETIIEKDIGGFEKILEPKVQGTLALDEALNEVFSENCIEFICYFSSTSAILGDFGSCDYAIANRFQMAYAHYRNKLIPESKAIVINWPLWRNGGMHIDEEEKDTKMLLISSGQRFLETEEALELFDRLLAQDGSQHLVLVGQPSKVHSFLGLTQDKHPITPDISHTSGTGRGRRMEMKGLSVEQCVEWDIKELISNLLKISRDKLDSEENLSEFGFDSISLAEFSKVLTDHYSIEITPSLFFGHSTVEKLTQYFSKEYRQRINDFYKDGVYEQVIPAHASSIPTQNRKPVYKAKAAGKQTEAYEPIAIIGMSGRFPDARNIDEMWRILEQGKCVVEEAPKDRLPGMNSQTARWKCGWLPGVSEFDPLFFEISPKEAEVMDPRQRLLLQEAWNALEDAGYGERHIKNSKIGMFVGAEQGDYQFLTKDKAGITSNINSILAARLSYFLNLDGPVLSIDTACSSALVAAHQAILCLRNGECDTAVVAGVNTMLTLQSFVGINQAGMLSPDGKCYAFDKRANGMVPGEAVAVVVLKRLSQAMADRDPIYAVIQGSGINYDGKTNGITAPSGVAQRELIKSVYDKYKVNPEEIDYIVTHGTGTKLGDPIEINALYDTFLDYTKKKGYCALTSTKTNFGHTFAASGLVSLISLVQALRHEMIPASLHCEQENDYIHWDESPFYVNKAARQWKYEDGKTRKGAVSAFGVSGTNAHIVVQSYDKAVKTESLGKVPYYLLVFSAKTPSALQKKLQDMVDTLQNKDFLKFSMLQISYTLQEGRQHFNHRCAIVIQDREDAVYILKKENSMEKLPNLFKGTVPRGFKGQKAMYHYMKDLLNKCQSLAGDRQSYQETLLALADLYCQGYEIDWQQMYGNTEINRIHLPVYPFAREKYWVYTEDNNPDEGKEKDTYGLPVLHPLIHQNTSNLTEQRFSSIFTGHEVFLKDHIVNGQRILPGVAYLEMARAAVEQAADSLAEESTSITLKNVVWTRPLVVKDREVRVNISLFYSKDGSIGYEVYSEADGDEVIHSQGSATLGSASKVTTLDIKAIQAQCNRGSISSAQCYEVFKLMGFDYGPGHRGIEEIFLGSGQVLAKLLLPPSVSGTQGEYVLHPGLMDSALQSAIGLTSDVDGVPRKPIVPFALQELEVFGRCSPNMWALIRYSEGSSSEDKLQKLDLDLCDEQGTVCARMKGFSARVLDSQNDTSHSSGALGTLLLEPYWKHEEVYTGVDTPVYKKHLVMFCETGEFISENNASQMGDIKYITLESDKKEIENRFQDYAVQAFKEVKSIIADKSAGKVLIQILIPFQGEKQVLSGLAGLLRTAALEYPQITGQLIELEPGWSFKEILTKLIENGGNPADRRIKYKDGKRYIDRLRTVEVSREKAGVPWRDKGVYLITGGSGGLGLIFAREIVMQVKNTTLFLTGRSELSEEKQTKLRELEQLGARVIYKQVDVTKSEAVYTLIESIVKEFGALHGILHSAGVIQDNYILKKDIKEFEKVLDPKVTGLVNLDKASRDVNLDFLVIFSSLAGITGNVGQSDYSTANAFMDAYAKYRNMLVSENQCSGLTLSINWPLWKEGGMHVSKETEELLNRRSGMSAMEIPTGIKTLYQGFLSGKEQLMVVEGDIERLNEAYLGRQSYASDSKATDRDVQEIVIQAVSQDELHEKALDFFKKQISSVLKLPVQRIEVDAPLEKYGIDSLVAMELTTELEKTFGSLSKTLFFEYQNIQQLTEYFLEAYREQLVKLLGLEGAKAIQNSAGQKAETEFQKPNMIKPNLRRPKGTRFISVQTELKSEKDSVGTDIAIIGISGRYPGAENIREFWEKLKNGEDCITEIPRERWDNSLYFDEERYKPGKTYCKWGGFIDGVYEFDPLFFNISPREAEVMDPMCRLFLETVWIMMEEKGYTRDTVQNLYQGRVGVYVGAMYQQYQAFQTDIMKEAATAVSSYSSIANRVSHYFNFQGPSIAIDTMCSSAAIGMHMACESLISGESKLAIAGGVNLSIHPKKYIGLSQSQMLGSHRESRSFGDGDGYLPAEGVGAVLLKPLSEAIRDKDNIFAVIKSTTINHGGHTNGFSVPNPNAQAQMMEDNFNKSGINPRTISYIEAAANGSALGDPIEVTALNKSFRKFTQDQQFCAIGSVKSNIGHPEAVSGMAQLTKVVLQLQNRQLVPSIKANPVNPNIDFKESPFYLQQELQDWKRPIVDLNGETREFPRRAAINSFGAGGSNAHLIVEEYIPDGEEIDENNKNTDNKPHIAVFSAKSLKQLTIVVEQMANFMEDQKDISLSRLVYTLQMGREAMEYRLAMVVSSTEELIKGMEAYLKAAGDGENIDSSIAIFMGNSQDTMGIRSFLTGKLAETVLQALIADNNLEKIALYWVQGGKFPWELLNNGQSCRMMSLPTYPFEKQRFGFEIKPDVSVVNAEEDNQIINKVVPDGVLRSFVDERVIGIVSGILGVKATELDINMSLDQYGLDSILLMPLLQQLQSQLYPSLDLDKLKQCRTTKDIIRIIPDQEKNNTRKDSEPETEKLTEKQEEITEEVLDTVPDNWKEIAEIIHLNQVTEGRPVFWMHAGLGGVESYQEVAQRAKRPFFGIQACGWMTDKAPIRGIEHMAEYYIKIIRKVQPEGPYDLGGYSLGGAIAYEVTRQLQEMGQVVDTIVMFDSHDSNGLKKIVVTDKSNMLQAVNTWIISTMIQNPEKLAEAIIHRDQIDVNLGDEEFLTQIINLAIQRGLTKPEAQLYDLVRKTVEIQSAYERKNFSVLPLLNPHSVNCYYFLNKSGLLYGDLDGYFSAVPDSSILLDHTEYWEEWEKQLQNFHIIEVDASNHMTLLSDPKTNKTIFEFCSKLYSEKHISNSSLLAYMEEYEKKNQIETKDV